ncbi:MAG: hypothetical protein BAJATHORv1_40178 [Candidatus Thorarchaeota archaeon]|nr:MAG: hypothetical protein BAJATHORv1_40178 [Candidatus Thorarchaeota archaeon]
MSKISPAVAYPNSDSLVVHQTRKEEGWLYALIVNILTIPMAIFIIPTPVLMAFPLTFAILIIFIMLIPPIREPFK